MKALALIFFLPVCGCVLQSKYDDSQKQVESLSKQLKITADSLTDANSNLGTCQAHKYQMFSSGFRTWRLDTVTGNSCIALTSDSDWKSKRTKAQSCDCKDLFDDPKVFPEPALTKLYCGF